MLTGLVFILVDVSGIFGPSMSAIVEETYRGYDIYYDDYKASKGLPPFFIGGGDIPGDFWTRADAKAAIDDYLGPPPAENQAPIAKANVPSSGTEGITTKMTSTGSSDPDGDPITFYWTFGDGESSTSATAYHKWTSPGTYTVKLVVTDPDGATGSDSSTISIKSAPEEPPPSSSYSGQWTIEGQSTTETSVIYLNKLEVTVMYFLFSGEPNDITRVRFRAWKDGAAVIDTNLPVNAGGADNDWRTTVTFPGDGVYDIMGHVYWDSGSNNELSISTEIESPATAKLLDIGFMSYVGLCFVFLGMILELRGNRAE